MARIHMARQPRSSALRSTCQRQLEKCPRRLWIECLNYLNPIDYHRGEYSQLEQLTENFYR